MDVEFCEIEKIEAVNQTCDVYDIEVEEDHSYTVQDKFVVHNSACQTRTVTGFGVSQFSAIQDCAEVANELRVPLIADGGIRDSRDVALALAAGASSVMVGKLFALTDESAAEKRIVPGFTILPVNERPQEAKYRGQASKDFQDEFYGGLKEGTVPEGDAFWAPTTGPAQNTIDTLVGGLRSAMTYGGARNIKEFQRKAEFVEVTNTYHKESSVRKN